MKNFKSILLKLHGENKQSLRWLYVDRQIYLSSMSSSEQPIEEEKLFTYQNLAFRFTGTGMRHPERMNLYLFLPQELFVKPSAKAAASDPNSSLEFPVPCEDYLLRILSPAILRLSQEYENDHKDSREKAKFECQSAGPCILRRSGLIYDASRELFVLRLLFHMPLINGTTVNAKSGFRAVRDVLDTVELALTHIDAAALQLHLDTYRRQTEIRRWLTAHHKVAFVADGSILPRQPGSALPLKGAVPFASPDTLRETLTLSDGFRISGMAIPQGVTVVTGGGYSGKSTLLDALEQGIYHHIPGDGREYVLSCQSCTKIYAEDGRPVQETDLSLFFQRQGAGPDFRHFSTPHASGSVSQAANILEAVYAGCELLLIDEDTSATNFMIRDTLIRRLVKKEPIIPFTDRVRPLYRECGISTILVIGGSGEYLRHADLCLLMEDYKLSDVTKDAGALISKQNCLPRAARSVEETTALEKKAQAKTASKGTELFPAALLRHRYLKMPETSQPFSVSQCVSVDQAHYIQIDGYTGDVTRLTALISEDQFHTLAYLLEYWLASRQPDLQECREAAEELIGLLSKPEVIDKVQEENYRFTLWLEQIRPIDLLTALFRMRGIAMSSSCP